MPRLNTLGNKPANVLWIIPLIATVLPAAAALASLWLSIALGNIPACNPFIDGCVSISRTARYDPANHLFRILVLPAAALQGLTWLLCWSWLKGLGEEPRKTLRLLPWLGMVAAVFLLLYVGLLGTRGSPYTWIRHYGVLIYFGSTYVCMQVTAVSFRHLARSGAIKPPARFDGFLLLLCLLTLGIWIVQTFLRPFIGDKDFQNRLTNFLEWYTELAYTLFFLALAWLWWSMRFTVQLVSNGLREPLSEPFD